MPDNLTLFLHDYKWFDFRYTQNGNEIQLCLVLKFEKNSLNKSWLALFFSKSYIAALEECQSCDKK